MEKTTVKKYTHISFDERKIIERLLRKNTPKREIARLLNRSITTIRKEIKRGSVEQRRTVKTTKKSADIPLYTTELVYYADNANQDYIKKRKNCGCKCKAVQCRDFLNYVEKQVKTKKWSLDSAAGYAKEHNLFANTVTTQRMLAMQFINLIMTKGISLIRLKSKRKKAV